MPRSLLTVSSRLPSAVAFAFVLSACSSPNDRVQVTPQGATDAGGDAGASAPRGMLLVPGATFWMGCNASIDTMCSGPGAVVDGESPADELPYHQVSVPAFYLDTTHVSQGDYEPCVRATACTAPTSDWSPGARASYPVHFVTWPQADQFCAWAGKRLPTEAEFELAARGTDGRVYPWGNDPPTCDRANFAPHGARCAPLVNATSTEPVGSHSTNAGPYGHLDLAGNLWQWMSDWYSPTYYASSPSSDPRGPSTGDAHAKRGGSLIDEAFRLRTSRRWHHPTNDPVEDVGFRCAKSAP
jgi:formylglycine-generating enzyme required for sulfatase activity